jgi:hypothetical protein
MRKTDWALKWIPDQRSIFSESSLTLTAAVEGIFLLYIHRVDCVGSTTLLIDTYIKKDSAQREYLFD